MKFSVYLSFIPISDSRIIAYNALYDNFAILRNYDLTDINSPETLKLKDNDTYNGFVENKWIIPDEVDESLIVDELIETYDNTDTEFHLHINPTLDCNFHCWYCYENHINGSIMSAEVLKSSHKAIEQICSNQKLEKLYLGFFGGEPLLGFEDICKPLIIQAEKVCSLKDINLHIQFTSNGYLLTNSMIDFLKPRNTSFQITVDGNRDTHNKIRFPKNGGDSFDKILHNVRSLLSNGIEVILRFNYTRDSLNTITQIIPEFNNLPISAKQFLTLDLQRVWQDDKKDDYSKICNELEEITAEFEDAGIEVKDSNIFDYVKNSCYGDRKNYALINFDGNLFSCTARDFTDDNSTGKILENGELSWNERKAHKMTQKFTREICKSCKIAPICGGGCRQNHINHPGTDFCIFGAGSERELRINDIILSRFEKLCIPN